MPIRFAAGQSDIVYLMRFPKIALVVAALGAMTSGLATVFAQELISKLK